MLEARHITKKFSGVNALTDASLVLEAGKVTAIIGENGAGKSTLMNIFSGVYTEYEGEIIYKGEIIKFRGTKDASEKGIAIIHQELNLVPHLSITENIFLGREIISKWGLLDKNKMEEIALELLSRLNLRIDPSVPVASIKVGQQQLVEIAKALYINASVIIMDEPTSAISDKEVENLFSIISQLKSEGKTIAYISHKFNEVFAIADNYIVLRDGRAVANGEVKAVSKEYLIEKMTGRKISAHQNEYVSQEAPPILQVQHLTLYHPEIKSLKLLEDISFGLKKGEIVGIYGLMGAGRTELMESVFGLHSSRMKGQIKVDQEIVTINSPSDAINAGIALVPEDRKLQGLILNQSVSKNIVLTVLSKVEQWWGGINGTKEKQLCDTYIDRLNVKVTNGHHAVEKLSGGNQQKVVLAKWLATHPKILLLDEPTRGIDVNAKAEIYSLILSLAKEGMGIIMVSSELPEILAVSHRVMVMCEGKITADIPGSGATEQEILKHAIPKN